MTSQSPVYRKEFIFDIDTKQGNKYFGSYRKIYPVIHKYLTGNGFFRIEGSAYRSVEPMKRERFLRLFRKLLKENPDLAQCIKEVHLSEVIDDYSLNEYVENFKKSAHKRGKPSPGR